MIKRNKKTGDSYNKIRKEFYSAVTIGTTNAEKDFTAFNKNAGSSDSVTVFQTNWPSNNAMIPAHMSMDIKRVGLAVHAVDGSAVTAATLRKLARATYSIQNGDREVKSGSLQEFIKLPGANSGSLESDYFAGPSYKELEAAEHFNGNDALNVSLHLPANIGQAVDIEMILDTVTYIKQQ